MEKAITLPYLLVSSRTVLGETQQLSVASPCSFSNAKGNLRTVEDYQELASIGAQSGETLRRSLAEEIEKRK